MFDLSNKKTFFRNNQVFQRVWPGTNFSLSFPKSRWLLFTKWCQVLTGRVIDTVWSALPYCFSRLSNLQENETGRGKMSLAMF